MPKSVNCAFKASTPSRNAVSNETLLGLNTHSHNISSSEILQNIQQ